MAALDPLRLQFAGGFTMHEHPKVFTSQKALQIRIQREVPGGEVARVTLRDRDGTLLFEGEVR